MQPLPSSDPKISDEEACAQAIKKGSLSFALASLLLKKDHRTAIYSLYSWCRWCDDAIDELPTDATYTQKNAVLDQLRLDTDAALIGRYLGDNYVFRSLQQLNVHYQIPATYFHDLLAGMEMDTWKFRYENMDELRLYCFRVAGTVGLIFSHIVGVADSGALDHAVALGTAMQLTNIARDVQADFNMGRVYLPEQWLSAEGVACEDLVSRGKRQQAWKVIRRLIRESEEYYRVGAEGTKFLPWTAALAALAGLNIYSEIGRKILKAGPMYLETRVSVSGFSKMLLLIRAVVLTGRQLPYRLFKPFKRTEIKSEWRYQ